MFRHTGSSGSLLYCSALGYYYAVVAQVVLEVVMVAACFKVIVAFLVEEVFLLSCLIDDVIAIVHLSG